MARDFNGSSHYAEYGGLVSETLPLTFACWIKPDVVTGVRILMSEGVAANNTDKALAIYLNAAALNGYAHDGSGSAGATATGSVSAGAWSHAAAVFTSATDRKVYRDGGNVGTNTTSVSVSGMNRAMLGAQHANGGIVNYFDGKMAEVAIYAAALSVDEVHALAVGHSPLLVRPGDLLAYWRLGGNDSPEPDSWENAYALTLTGPPTKADHPPMIYPTAEQVQAALRVFRSRLALMGAG